MSVRALHASQVVRTFSHPSGPVRVLDRLDLTVRAGELVTLSGPSGSGKSALLAVLAGFDAQDAGTVDILEQPVGASPSWQRCAVLPQGIGLASELTLAENIGLPLILAGRPAPDTEVLGLLTQLDIAGLADRYPNQVSFGQQQRAALARAVIGKPAVLLADEPTAHLDQASSRLVLAMLRETADAGTAVLVATHDPAVHAIADRTLELRNGQLNAA